MARIIQTADLTPNQPLLPDEAEWCYNGLDCGVTLEVLHAIAPQLDNTTRATYEFSKALQAPVLEMSMRGLLVNRERRDKVLAQYREEIERIGENLTTIIREGIGLDINWRSPVQLRSLMYDVLGLKPIRKRNANGQMVPTVNREALERLSLYFIAEPICSHLLALRDLDKKRQFLETEIDADGRIRCNFNIAGTNTGRLASSMSEFGTGCVRPTAEALTPQGWRAISTLQDGDLIAQWDKGEITFVPAKFNWFDFDGELLCYSSEQTQLAVTPEHRCLWRMYHDEDYRTTAANAVFKRNQTYFPLCGNFVGGTLEVPAYVAMLMADASLEGKVWRVSFKKKRKIERFLAITDGLDVTENKAREGYRRFTIRNEEHWPKRWGPWVLALTPECANALVEEAKHWDAHCRGNSFIFYSADREQAEWFQTLCHLTGRSATLRQTVNSDTAYGNNSIIYSVNVKPKQEVQILSKHWHKIPYTGKVGCPTVPSSFWFVRENGYISVTGNTNLQNVDRDLRSCFIADPGMIFINLDLEQADARNVGAICWNHFVDQRGEREAGAYLDACESGDLHTTVCRMAWQSLDWPADRKDWRAVADQIAYRNMSYRDLAKRLGHGTNFYGTPPTMARHTKVDRRAIEEFQRAYFAAFPVIGSFDRNHNDDNWHNRVRRAIKETASITTLLGRRRFFFGRHTDDETIRAAIAYEPQSLTADEIDTGIIRVWRAGRVWLMLQVHDSLLIQCREEEVEEVVPWAIEMLSTRLILARGREFVVPVEAKVGWNWGDYDEKHPEKNPDGLMKWKGSQTRKRQEHPQRLSALLL